MSIEADRLSVLLGIAVFCGAILSVAPPVYAGPTVTFQLDPNNTIPGVDAYSVIADGEGEDWLIAALRIELTEGSLYNDPEYDFDRPVPLLWSFSELGLERLRWDTWVGIPGDDTHIGPLPLIEFGGSGTSFTGQVFQSGWANTDTTNTGPTLIGNISTTTGARGTWQMLVSFSGEEGFIELSGDWPVPEPGTLGLVLGAAGLALYRRRA